MSCYISSNNNRFYVALESAYGRVPGITGQNRIPGVKLAARQVPEQNSRRDKSGSRTFVGLPNSIRKRTAYQLNTFMTDWVSGQAAPSHGPLFQAAMGGTPLAFAGGTVAMTSSTTQLGFSAAHGLSTGQAVANGGEIRFIAAIQDSMTVFLVAPFTSGVVAGTVLGPTLTYQLGSDLGSVSIFDYWDPASALQRILNGAAIDTVKDVGPVGIIGFCLGGSIAYAAATKLSGLSAAVGYYGGAVVRFADEKPKVPTQLHFGEKDTGIPLTDVETIKTKRPDVEVHIYPGAQHGFHCDERASYDKASADIAWPRSLAFFAKHLK